MITKLVNKLENKLTPLLLSFIPLALLIIYKEKQEHSICNFTDGDELFQSFP